MTVDQRLRYIRRCGTQLAEMHWAEAEAVVREFGIDPDVGRFGDRLDWAMKVLSDVDISVLQEMAGHLDWTPENASQPPLTVVNNDQMVNSIPPSGAEAVSQLPSDRKRKVWVVYGRDEKIRIAMFDFLRALHLEPLEWDHAIEDSGGASPFVGEVIDATLNKAQAIVVLFTGDDNAVLRPALQRPTEAPEERRLLPQPRPNVLFEAGMAFARAQDRTVIVEVGTIRPISDLAGRHTIRMDNSPEKRNALAQRLKRAGCPINTVGGDWLKTGDFQ